MSLSPGFLEQITAALVPLGGIATRKMFGAAGIYQEGQFFAILSGARLFFRVDAESRLQYERAGMTAFRPYADRPMTFSYMEVPPAVIGNAQRLRAYAERAVRAAREAPRKPRRKRLSQRAQQQP